MSKNRLNINRIVLPLLAVFMLAGFGYAPEQTTEYIDEMSRIEPLLSAYNDYDWYGKLYRQAGMDETLQVIELIESSSYPELVKAIIEVESTWRTNALSFMDARGLMQIRPIAAYEVVPDLDIADLYDPVINVQIGIAIFEAHMDFFTEYNETEHWALTAYNRGRQGTFNLKQAPPRTTYSHKVLDLKLHT